MKKFIACFVLATLSLLAAFGASAAVICGRGVGCFNSETPPVARRAHINPLGDPNISPYLPGDLQLAPHSGNEFGVWCPKNTLIPGDRQGGPTSCHTFTSPSTGTTWMVRDDTGHVDQVWKVEGGAWSPWVAIANGNRYLSQQAYASINPQQGAPNGGVVANNRGQPENCKGLFSLDFLDCVNRNLQRAPGIGLGVGK